MWSYSHVCSYPTKVGPVGGRRPHRLPPTAARACPQYQELHKKPMPGTGQHTSQSSRPGGASMALLISDSGHQASPAQPICRVRNQVWPADRKGSDGGGGPSGHPSRPQATLQHGGPYGVGTWASSEPARGGGQEAGRWARRGSRTREHQLES